MELHIGKEIEKKYQESGLKLAEFAKRLNTGTRNIYSIFNRSDINSAQLKVISEVLKFDFFTLYQKQISSLVEEPSVKYSANNSSKPNNSIQLVIQLDGTPELLKGWIEKLQRINSALA